MAAAKPPLSKTDSPAPGEVARSVRGGAGAEPARRRDFFPSAGVTAYRARPVGIPPAAYGVHLPLTREALSFVHKPFLIC